MDNLEDNKMLSRSKAGLYIVIAVVISILATAYVYNSFYTRQFDEFVLTTNIAEARQNVSLARSLRAGDVKDALMTMDIRTGEDAIIFTDYRTFAPEKIHKDISETLTMIKTYRREFGIGAQETEIQKKINKSLEEF